MAPNRSSVKLVYGTQIRSSRRLYATRALGLHDQATRKGAQQRAPSATGNDLPRRLRGLRSRASRVQWPERSRPLGDHVHLLVSYPPKVGISEVVNSLKGVSSRRLKREFPSIKAFWSVKKSRAVLWTPSYFAAWVGRAPLCVLKHYIEQQTRPS